MSTSAEQKRLYLLAAILILAVLMLLMAFGGEKEEKIEPTPTPEAEQTKTTPTEVPEAVSTMATTVIYQDDYGYLVPVTRSIKAETGVAKATLNLMVKSVYNDMEAARLGLRTVIPENTTFDLDISKGVARLDMSKEALSCPDAASERNMVDAVVQTLSNFSTVDKVKFLIGGQEMKTLTHGTRVDGEFVSGMLNLESTQAEGADSAVTLYFTGDSPSMIVPVTRAVYGTPDIATAVLELVKGPSADSPLDGVIPAGCGLLGVEVQKGVAKINFTEDFIRIAEASDGGRLAMRALVLTCSQFDGVQSVEILVNGQPYDPGAGTLAMPTFVNSFSDIADAFIQAKSDELFEFE